MPLKKKGELGLEERIEVPAEIELKVEGNKIIMKKDSKIVERKLDSDITISQEGNKLTIRMKKAKKDERRKFGSAKSHIKNMIEGLLKEYEYELEICNVHFPITVTFDKTKSEFMIKNFLGEKAPRIIKVNGPVDVEIKAPRIKIKSHDIEIAGQAAANLEKLARIRNRDRNKFQDGVFIIRKPGVVYL